MSQHQGVHDLLNTKGAAVVSWISAAMGLGTLVGIVNLVVGALSALWLAVQLWNYFVYTLPKNRADKAAGWPACDVDDGGDA